MSSEELIIRTESLGKYYQLSTGIIEKAFGSPDFNKAVDNVNIKIYNEETYGLVGESGSGKTTLGETILKLRKPSTGTIYYNGSDMNAMSKSDLKEFRKDAQIILQDPYEALNPRQSIFQAVSEPLKNFYSMSNSELEEKVLSILSDVGLRPPEELLHSYPEQLSGGQRQRVNIARALILEPNFLVADEPLSMLDVSVQAGIIKLLNNLKQKYNFTLLYISHDLSIVNQLSDRVGVMYKGSIVEEGKTERIFQEPKHPYTRALVGSLPDLSRERDRVILPDDTTDEGEQICGCDFHPRCPKKMDECTEATPRLKSIDEQKVACYLHHNKSISE